MRLSMLLQKLASRLRDYHQLSSVVVHTGNEPAVVRVFPNGKPRTRRAPRVEDFLVSSLSRPEPQEQVNYQCVNGCI